MAADAQRRMIPVRPPSIPGLDIGATYVPRDELSGDFYDFIDLPPENLGIVIGDVVGSGFRAALLMAANPQVFKGGCEGRIIVPIFVRKKVLGWQASLAVEPSFFMKDEGFQNTRWLGMPGGGWKSKSLVVYDPAAKARYPYCIVVEGPTDVARQGPPCIGTLGLGITRQQEDLIVETRGNRLAIIVVGDAGENVRDVPILTAAKLALRCTCRVYGMALPKGDPDSWDRDSFYGFIKEYMTANQPVQRDAAAACLRARRGTRE